MLNTEVDLSSALNFDDLVDTFDEEKKIILSITYSLNIYNMCFMYR